MQNAPCNSTRPSALCYNPLVFVMQLAYFLLLHGHMCASMHTCLTPTHAPSGLTTCMLSWDSPTITSLGCHKDEVCLELLEGGQICITCTRFAGLAASTCLAGCLMTNAQTLCDILECGHFARTFKARACLDQLNLPASLVLPMHDHVESMLLILVMGTACAHTCMYCLPVCFTALKLMALFISSSK